VNIETISAVTLEVSDMTMAVRFYRDVLGMEIIYGGEDGYFSSLRTRNEKGVILNLEQGRSVTGWGRLIFYVADVDALRSLEKSRCWMGRCGDVFGKRRPAVAPLHSPTETIVIWQTPLLQRSSGRPSSTRLASGLRVLPIAR